MGETVALIDYGAGNLHSVENALRRVGADVALVADAGALARAERIVPATSALEIGQLRVSFNSPLFVWDTSGLIDRTPSFPGNANMYSMTTSAIRGTLSVEVSRMGVSISPSSCT